MTVNTEHCDDKFTTDEAGRHSPPVGLSARGHHHPNLTEALRTGERRVVFTRAPSHLPGLVRVAGGEMTYKESLLLQGWTLAANLRKCIGQNPGEGRSE